MRVLQDGEVRRVGEMRVRHIDARVICATHRSLEQMVADGSFRAALYYRLFALVVDVPPLRERKGDIALLAAHFLDRLTQQHHQPKLRLADEALALLESCPWPGNVRQLEHVLQRAFVMAAGETLLSAEIVLAALGSGNAERPATTFAQAMMQYERGLIQTALEACGGVITAAARRLGLTRSTLSRRCKRLGIKLYSS